MTSVTPTLVEAAQPVRLADILAERVAQVKRRNKPTGHHPLISHCNSWDRLWGSRPVNSITFEELEEWVCQRRSEVKDSTIVAQLAQLRKVFDLAIRSGRTASNPVNLIDMKFAKPGRRSRRLSRQEEQMLQEAYRDALSRGVLRPKAAEWAALEWSSVRFAVLTGCRRMEQLQLTARSIETVSGGHLLHIRDGKTGPRTIPLHPEAYGIAQQWLAQQRPPGSNWIFWPDQTGDRFNFGLRHYRRVFTPLRKAAGLDDLHWHDLRRTFACRLIEQGVPIFEVQQLLGHSDPKMTMIYACVAPEQLRASVMKMWSPSSGPAPVAPVTDEALEALEV